jgi:transcriptional regulator with XRE-family HTH domain
VPRRKTADPEAELIGQRIKALREERGLGLEELAHAADFSKGHLSSLERGLVMPTVATLSKLADALEVLVADIVSSPERSLREKVLDLTRHTPTGPLKRLAKDLSVLKRSGS